MHSSSPGPLLEMLLESEGAGLVPGNEAIIVL